VAQRISNAYEPAIKVSIVLQGLVLLLGVVTLDGGHLLGVFLCTAVGYWIGALLAILRRPSTPRPVDLRLIKFGYAMLIPVGTLPDSAIAWWRVGHPL
jgi:hypothetical protein